MSRNIIYSIHFIALFLVGQTIGVALPNVSRIYPRDTFDIKRFGYLGDSFAAGPGAGDAYDGVTSCRRSKQAWGPLVAKDDRLHGPKPLGNFDFIACSGAKSEHIFTGGTGASSGNGDGQPKEAQASLLKDTNPELVTLSIGGNDIGFTNLLIRVSLSETSSSL